MNFKFLNIPIQIHPSFWIFLLFFTDICRDPSFKSLISGLVLFYSILFHEYGHALTALCFGKQPIINLEAFGGNAQYDGSHLRAKQRFLITFNGPLFTGILIVLSYYLLRLDILNGHQYILYTIYYTMRLNILLLLLNLLPLEPLDGGRLARYLLESKFKEKGYQASLILGLVCVLLAVPYLLYAHYFFFAILIAIFGFKNFKELKSSTHKISPFACYMQAIEAVKDNENEKAKLFLKKIINCKDLQIKHSAIEALAKIYVEEKKEKKAYDLLRKANPELLKEGKCLLCKLAFAQKNYALISKYALEIYDIDPTFETALLNSKAYGHLNQPFLAGGWLNTASQFGNACDIDNIVMDEAYQCVKEHHDFKQSTDKLTFVN